MGGVLTPETPPPVRTPLSDGAISAAQRLGNTASKICRSGGEPFATLCPI